MHRYRDVENHAGTAKGTVGGTPHSTIADLYGGAGGGGGWIGVGCKIL